MKDDLDMLSASRWFDELSYDIKWGSRSSSLLDMFIDHVMVDNKTYSLSEFGCGPYSPFFKLCKNDSRFNVKKFDLKKWDDLTSQIDLNNKEINFEKSDIFCFSGVLEYLDDLEGLLKIASLRSNYMLISYAHLPSNCSSKMKYIKAVKNRTKSNGWRNHYTYKEFFALLSKIGVLLNTSSYEGNQSLFVLKSFNFKE